MLTLCFLERCILLFTKSQPIEKAVKVIAQKSEEAGDHREIGRILQGGNDPQHNQNDVVCGVGKSIPGASAVKQIGGKKAGCHRKGANPYLGGVKRAQNEEEYNRI